MKANINGREGCLYWSLPLIFPCHGMPLPFIKGDFSIGWIATLKRCLKTEICNGVHTWGKSGREAWVTGTKSDGESLVDTRARFLFVSG